MAHPIRAVCLVTWLTMMSPRMLQADWVRVSDVDGRVTIRCTECGASYVLKTGEVVSFPLLHRKGCKHYQLPLGGSPTPPTPDTTKPAPPVTVEVQPQVSWRPPPTDRDVLHNMRQAQATLRQARLENEQQLAGLLKDLEAGKARAGTLLQQLSALNRTLADLDTRLGSQMVVLQTAEEQRRAVDEERRLFLVGLTGADEIQRVANKNNAAMAGSAMFPSVAAGEPEVVLGRDADHATLEDLEAVLKQVQAAAASKQPREAGAAGLSRSAPVDLIRAEQVEAVFPQRLRDKPPHDAPCGPELLEAYRQAASSAQSIPPPQAGRQSAMAKPPGFADRLVVEITHAGQEQRPEALRMQLAESLLAVRELAELLAASTGRERCASSPFTAVYGDVWTSVLETGAAGFLAGGPSARRVPRNGRQFLNLTMDTLVGAMTPRADSLVLASAADPWGDLRIDEPASIEQAAQVAPRTLDHDLRVQQARDAIAMLDCIFQEQ